MPLALSFNNGSSPRLWGTPSIIDQDGIFVRFIPTAVGNADRTNSPSHQTTVHPHGCGERRSLMHPAPCKIGSSPRLWGTLKFLAIRCLWLRFIPTAVGNALYADGNPQASPVHPHGCGERLLAR